jgi:asparagine N-glycosylation enzyme membrane subunit Stt3
MDMRSCIRARREHLLLLAVFLIALALRLTTANYDRLLGADPWYHFKIAQLVLETGEYPVWEYYSRYPLGEPVLNPPGLYYLPVLIFKFLSFAGVSFFKTFQLLPAIFGSLSTLPLYLLVKELFDRKIALFSTLLIAISPAAIERGLAGYLRGDVFFVFTMLFTFYFFVYSVKKDLRVSLLGALFLFLSSLVWKGWGYGFMVISVAYVLGLISNYIKRKDSKNLILSYLGTCGVGISLLYILKSIFYKYATGMGGIVTSLEIVFLLTLLGLIEMLNRALIRNTWKPRAAVPLAFILIMIFAAYRLEYLQSIYQYILDNYKTVLYSPEVEALVRLPIHPWRLGISEQDRIDLLYLFHAYGILALLAPVGLFLLLRKPPSNKIFLMVYVLSSLSLLLFQVRFAFLVSPAVCLLGALPFYYMSIQKDRKRYISFVLISFFIISNASTASGFSSDAEPLVSQDLYESLLWLKHNTPEDSVVLAWWDYTGPILAIANRKAVTHTHPSIVSEGTALMFLTPQEAQALYIARTMKEAGVFKDVVDYILVDQRTMELWPRMLQFTPPTYYREISFENKGMTGSMLFKFFKKEKLESFRLVYYNNRVVIYKPLYNYTKITELDTKRYYKSGEEVSIKVKTRSNEHETVLLSLRIIDPKNALVFSSNQTIKGNSTSVFSLTLPHGPISGAYQIIGELFNPQMNKTHSMKRYFILVGE